MKTSNRRRPDFPEQFESPETLRKRLTAFALATRDMALRRRKVEEPTVQGPVLVGRRVSSKN